MWEGAFAQSNNPGQEAVEISLLPSRPTALLTQQEKSGGEERKTPSGKLGHLESTAVMYLHLPLPQNLQELSQSKITFGADFYPDELSPNILRQPAKWPASACLTLLLEPALVLKECTIGESIFSVSLTCRTGCGTRPVHPQHHPGHLPVP